MGFYYIFCLPMIMHWGLLYIQILIPGAQNKKTKKTSPLQNLIDQRYPDTREPNFEYVREGGRN